MTKIYKTFSIPFGDKPNKNGRIYSKGLVKSIADKVNSCEKFFPVTLGINESASVNLKDIKGTTNKSEYIESDNKLDVHCEIFDKQTIEMLEKELTLKLVPSGLGSLDDNGNIENYDLICFNLIDNSSFED